MREISFYFPISIKEDDFADVRGERFRVGMGNLAVVYVIYVLFVSSGRDAFPVTLSSGFSGITFNGLVYGYDNDISGVASGMVYVLKGRSNPNVGLICGTIPYNSMAGIRDKSVTIIRGSQIF